MQLNRIGSNWIGGTLVGAYCYAVGLVSEKPKMPVFFLFFWGRLFTVLELGPVFYRLFSMAVLACVSLFSQGAGLGTRLATMILPEGSPPIDAVFKHPFHVLLNGGSHFLNFCKGLTPYVFYEEGSKSFENICLKPTNKDMSKRTRPSVSLS